MFFDLDIFEKGNPTLWFLCVLTVWNYAWQKTTAICSRTFKNKDISIGKCVFMWDIICILFLFDIEMEPFLNKSWIL